MFVVNSKFYFQKGTVDAFLAALGTIPGAVLWNSPKVHLYTDAHVADPVNDTPASFTEPTFTGYAAAALTLTGPVNVGQTGRMKHGDCEWTCTADIPGGQTIMGCYVTDTTGATLYGQAPFDAPVPVQFNGDLVDLDLIVPIQYLQSAVGA